jgi:hypothetical protein
MIRNLLLLIAVICAQVSDGSYLYDRFNNRAVLYRLRDKSNVYYASDAFHSVEYTKPHTMKTHNSTVTLRKVNRSTSLPNLR